MKRCRSLRVTRGDEELVSYLQALKAEHPVWGYRRIWTDRRVVQQRAVHHKRILRLRREPHRLVPPYLRLEL